MAKVLVTGGTGFVGSHVARRLCREGFSVRVLARPTSPRHLLEGLPVEIITGDLLDRESLRSAVRDCDTVFHVAADYRLWARRPQELYRNNVEGTENILEVSRNSGVSRFVYTSTVGTIGFSQNGAAATERNFPNSGSLVGAYKRSKYLAEQIALRYAREGFPVVVVNPTAPVGEGDRRPTDTGKIILEFLNRRMPAYLDTGLNLVDVRDVAEGHLAAMMRGKPGERYILGGRNMSLHQILEALAAITGLPSPRFRIPYRIALCAGAASSALAQVTGRPPRVPWDGVRMARHKMYVSSAKAEQELDYHPGPVEDALVRAVEWFRGQNMVVGFRS